MTERQPIQMTVNGQNRAVDVAVHHTLLDVLRADIGLTGTKACCLVGECGACTVLVDGRSVDSRRRLPDPGNLPGVVYALWKSCAGQSLEPTGPGVAHAITATH